MPERRVPTAIGVASRGTVAPRATRHTRAGLEGRPAGAPRTTPGRGRPPRGGRRPEAKEPATGLIASRSRTTKGALALVAGLLLLLVAFNIIVDAPFPPGTQRGINSLAIFGAALAVIALIKSARARDPFHPVGFPVLYPAFVLFTSAGYALVGGFGQYYLPADLITNRLMLTLGVFVAGLAIVPILARTKPHATRPDDTHLATGGFLLVLAGNLSLAVAVGLRLVALNRDGFGSFATSQSGATSGVVASLLPLAGVAMLVQANRPKAKAQIGAVALGLLLVWAAASLLIGTRDELLAPAVLLAWANHARGRRVGWSKLVVFGALAFILLAFVGIWRTSAHTATNGYGEILLRPVASATNTTALTVRAVPIRSPYLHGETYVAALKRLPTLGGNNSAATPEEDGTAAARFPAMIAYTAPSGLGFSPSAEAYWNYGLRGTLLASTAFGALLVVAYRFSDPWPKTPIGLVYAILMARVPLTIRADSYQQLRGMALVLGVLVLAWGIDRQLRPRPPAVRRVRSVARAAA